MKVVRNLFVLVLLTVMFYPVGIHAFKTGSVPCAGGDGQKTVPFASRAVGINKSPREYIRAAWDYLMFVDQRQEENTGSSAYVAQANTSSAEGLHTEINNSDFFWSEFLKDYAKMQLRLKVVCAIMFWMALIPDIPADIDITSIL